MPSVIIAPSGAPPSGPGGSSDIVVSLAADLPHATFSTVFSNVTGFVIPVTASPTEIWQVACVLLTNANSAAGSAADFRFIWTFPGGVTGFWGSQIEREVVTGGTAQPLAPSIGTQLQFGSGSTIAQGLIQFTAMIASNGNAGSVQLQWAQFAAGAAGAIITLKRMSTLIARKVAA